MTRDGDRGDRDDDNASDSTGDNASDRDGDNASDSEAEFTCDDCGEHFDRERGIRSAPMGDLDTNQWQRFDCPNCGRRVKTVFLGT